MVNGELFYYNSIQMAQDEQGRFNLIAAKRSSLVYVDSVSVILTKSLPPLVNLFVAAQCSLDTGSEFAAWNPDHAVIGGGGRRTDGRRSARWDFAGALDSAALRPHPHCRHARARGGDSSRGSDSCARTFRCGGYGWFDFSAGSDRGGAQSVFGTLRLLLFN